MWIALHGYARTGKTSVAQILYELEPRFQRVALGDLIKERCDGVLQQYLGISAWTEDPVKKEIIRPFLVHHGYHAYDELFTEFKHRCAQHPFLVNHRIFRLEECLWWVRKGGVIWEVQRPRRLAAEPAEHQELQRVRAAGLITRVIPNTGDLNDLRREVTHAYTALLPR